MKVKRIPRPSWAFLALLIPVFVGSAFANNPIPTVVGPVVPQAVAPGSGAFILKVYGANFVSGAVVNWNRSPRSTTFISAHELQAQILASDVDKPTAGNITVTNPPPGGGVSSSSYAQVEVHKPTATITVGRPHAYLNNSVPYYLVLSDFNNDGIFDFAATYSFSQIKTFLGNGDGTFRPGSIVHNYYGSGPAAIASGDFNNDGNEDLVYGADPNGPPTQLQVALGNGDDTFRKGSRFWHFQDYAFGVTVGDFNGDGNLDVVSVTSPSTLSVFLGQGNGSFKHLADYDQFIDTPFEVVPADFNGDGMLDLAVLTQGGPYILLGKGDGRFERPRRVIANDHAGCSFGPGLFVSDFNGDGIPDLAFCERDLPQNRGKIWVALGNGDGTFRKPISLLVAAQQGAFSFAVGDFNSDGKTDLLANYNITNALTETDLFLGNGDGTFQRKKVINLPGAPNYNAEMGIVPADLNSDGLLDLILQQPGNVLVFTQK